MSKTVGLSVLIGGVLACVAYAEVGSVLKDGQLALPANYKQWPVFLTNVQRPDLKQVRDIYVNPAGAQAVQGQMFPDGTVMVMELYSAKNGAQGQLEKDQLVKVFVMGKNPGWGQGVADNLKTGNWIFAAYDPKGKPLAEDVTKCRACHAPLAKHDFVHRYEEYFQKRGHVH
ncbi:MAG: cytochrome P460 family protein [Nitrospirota bacterium]